MLKCLTFLFTSTLYLQMRPDLLLFATASAKKKSLSGQLDTQICEQKSIYLEITHMAKSLLKICKIQFSQQQEITYKGMTLKVKRFCVFHIVHFYAVFFVIIKLLYFNKAMTMTCTMTNFINPNGQFKQGKCAQLLYLKVLVTK